MALRLTGQTSGYVELEAPAVAGDNTLTLPNGNGSSGQYLQTDGSGGLSWAGAGKILQVVQSIKNDTFTTTSTSAVTTGLTAAITPTASGNKVLVIISGLFHNTSASFSAFIYLYKDGSVVSGATGDAAGSRIRATMASRYSAVASNNTSSFTYLDTTSGTSEITYQLYMSAESTSTAVLGRNGNDSDSAGIPRVPTTLTLLEVAA